METEWENGWWKNLSETHTIINNMNMKMCSVEVNI